jgi:hypothetical protein
VDKAVLLDSPIADDGLIRTGGREYGTSEYIARTFGVSEPSGAGDCRASKLATLFLARIPEWTPAGRAVLGAWHDERSTRWPRHQPRRCAQCARSVRSRLAAALSDPLAAAGVKKALIRVPVRRPSPQKFIRVHAGEDCRLIRRSSTCAMTAKPTDAVSRDLGAAGNLRWTARGRAADAKTGVETGVGAAGLG